MPELAHDLVCLFLSAFVIWDILYPSQPIFQRAIFIGSIVVIVFLQGLTKRDVGWVAFAIDILAIVASIASFGYIIVNASYIDRMVLNIPWIALVLGIAAIVLLLEASRRGIGWSFFVLMIVVLAYMFWGQFLPPQIGGHLPFGLRRIISSYYLTTDGIFGAVTYVMLKYIFLFYFFGKLVERTGALEFVMKVALALVGRYRGGPAMVAAIASGMMGTVSGSAVANTMVIGNMTIPLMKRTGFKPEVAGGVEAAASTGGQFMPPVMGAAAFLIAENLGLPYIRIVQAALLPAVLYYFGILTSTYVYALRADLQAVPEGEIPSWREVFQGSAPVTFVGGFGVLIGLMVAGYSAPFAVLYAIGAVCIINLASRERLKLRDYVSVAVDTARSFAGLGAAAGAVGMVVATLMVTGMAGRFAILMGALVNHNLLLALLVTMGSAIVLGMGLPTSIIYILLSITLAPTLIHLGVAALPANMFIFYGGILSMVTPPVAMAAYAAATIAKTDFWRTGLWAFKLAVPAILIPYVFAYNDALLMIGSWADIVVTFVVVGIGIALLCGALIGTVKSRAQAFERILFFAAGVIIIAPIPGSFIYGAGLAVLGLIGPVVRLGRSRVVKLGL